VTFRNLPKKTVRKDCQIYLKEMLIQSTRKHNPSESSYANHERWIPKPTWEHCQQGVLMPRCFHWIYWRNPRVVLTMHLHILTPLVFLHDVVLFLACKSEGFPSLFFIRMSIVFCRPSLGLQNISIRWLAEPLLCAKRALVKNFRC
jgi:hypothetical protein